KHARERLDALAARLGVETLVIASQRAAGAPLGAVVWHRSKAAVADPAPPTAAGEETLARWIAAHLAADAPRVRAPRTPGSGALALTPAVAAIGAVRQRDLAGRGGGYSATFGGAGAQVSGLATWSSWIAFADA